MQAAKKNLAAIASALIFAATAIAAPVVVQKGSTAQYIYIPGSSVAAPSAGGGNDGATSAKQFCKVFATGDATYVAKAASMLEDSYKVGAILVGGGSGGNTSFTYTGWEGAGPYVYYYASAGGGGATAVLLNGVPVAVAAGANAPSAMMGAGNKGQRVTAPEFTVTRSPPGVVQVVVGAGGASATPSPGGYGQVGSISAGWGGRGYFGGGGGAMLQSDTSLPGFTWASPARGGTASGGGTGAVPLQGTNRFTGGVGSAMNGGAGSAAYAASPSQGALRYGQFVYGGYYSTGYEYVTTGNFVYGNDEFTNVSVNNNSSTVPARITSSVHGTTGPNENLLDTFGVGGSVSGNMSRTGTSGIVMLYYSAPSCNLF